MPRPENGLMKVGDAGLSGLTGSFRARMNWRQSCRLMWWSSGGVRNHSVVVVDSLVDMKPAARLERRFFSLSAMLMTRVGRTGPCLRWAICWTWQSLMVLTGYWYEGS